MEAFAITDVGRNRKVNQDAVFCTTDNIGKLKNLVIVADGMGGHQGGKYAAEHAVKVFVDAVKCSEKPNTVTIINECLTYTNIVLYEASQKSDELTGMGTTMVVASIEDDALYVANVGDSRLYIIADTIRQITRDHSLVEEMVADGKLERGSAEYFKQKNIITRAVGVYDHVLADYFEVELQKGDLILLCSDGLSNMVTDEQIWEIVSKGKSLDAISRQLIAAANENGGKDNISVVLFNPQLDEVAI